MFERHDVLQLVVQTRDKPLEDCAPTRALARGIGRPYMSSLFAYGHREGISGGQP